MKLKIPQSAVFVKIHEIEDIEMPQNIVSSNFRNLHCFFRNSYNNNMQSSPNKNFILIKLCCSQEYLWYLNYIDIIVE